MEDPSTLLQLDEKANAAVASECNLTALALGTTVWLLNDVSFTQLNLLGQLSSPS